MRNFYFVADAHPTMEGDRSNRAFGKYSLRKLLPAQMNLIYSFLTFVRLTANICFKEKEKSQNIIAYPLSNSLLIEEKSQKIIFQLLSNSLFKKYLSEGKITIDDNSQSPSNFYFSSQVKSIATITTIKNQQHSTITTKSTIYTQ